ncbi:hypothetical protein Tco_1238588 [Tanacetum coccineum]
MRSGLVSLTTARPVNTTQPKTTVNNARPMTNVFNKAHSTVRRPINNKTSFKNSNINQRVNTVKDKNVKTVRPKAVVNAARPKTILNSVKGNQGNPQMDLHDQGVMAWGNPQMDLQDQGVIDSGCSRHMTGNMSYLTDFEEIDGGYVAFGGNPKGGKITSREEQKKRACSWSLKDPEPAYASFKDFNEIPELSLRVVFVMSYASKWKGTLWNGIKAPQLCMKLSCTLSLLDRMLLREADCGCNSIIDGPDLCASRYSNEKKLIQQRSEFITDK